VDTPGGEGWAGGAARVAKVPWIAVGGGGGPLGAGGGAGAVVAAGCRWGNRGDRRGSLVEATPPLRNGGELLQRVRYDAAHAGSGAREGMFAVGGEERSVASTGNVCGSGGQVWHPKPRRRAPSKTKLAMVRARVVGRASKKAAAARQVMLWWHAREIWHPRVEPSCMANKGSLLAWAAAAECIRCARPRKPSTCAA
jgi:hypothetical protein